MKLIFTKISWNNFLRKFCETDLTEKIPGKSGATNDGSWWIKVPKIVIHCPISSSLEIKIDCNVNKLNESKTKMLKELIRITK